MSIVVGTVLIIVGLVWVLMEELAASVASSDPDPWDDRLIPIVPGIALATVGTALIIWP